MKTDKGFYPSGENPWRDTKKHKDFLGRRGEPFKGEWIVVHNVVTGERIRVQVKKEDKPEVSSNDAA